MATIDLRTGDNRELLKAVPDASIDSIVTDPPYEIGFLSKGWDNAGTAHDTGLWKECLRVLKPGGHLLAFGSPRTYHRMACAIEDAGFEIRDSLHWIHGQGFPKSQDVSKRMDKKAGAVRKVLGPKIQGDGKPTHPASQEAKDATGGKSQSGATVHTLATEPATEMAKKWNGWGTALKPAHEPIVMARKPLEGTVADNVLEFGTGAINVDASRVGTEQMPEIVRDQEPQKYGTISGALSYANNTPARVGRHPPNVLFSEEAATDLDAEVGPRPGGNYPHTRSSSFFGQANPSDDKKNGGRHNEDVKGPSTYFPVFKYVKKPNQKERHGVVQNTHPTVKPVELMKWLVTLVTPPGGTVLDPFMGSGTTGMAAKALGFNFIGMELDGEYVTIAQARINAMDAPLDQVAKAG